MTERARREYAEVLRRRYQIADKRDRGRILDTWTQAGAAAANKVRTELGVNYGNMTKTNGYIAVPLDGIWLRAPYLHNGSVPTLRDLLKPVDRRATVFYRGYDVYDRVNVGFVSNVPAEGGRAFFRFDTSERGNGNQGHAYGTDLAPKDKDALLEYLKTLRASVAPGAAGDELKAATPSWVSGPR